MSEGLVRPCKSGAEAGANLFWRSLRSMSPGMYSRRHLEVSGHSSQAQRWDDAQPTVRYLT